MKTMKNKNQKTRRKVKATAVPFFGLMACTRTSAYGCERPCEEAEEVPFVCVDRRATDDPMKLHAIGKAWYESGRNHRVENGMIARDFDALRWMVRIKDEVALQAFCEKYGQLVLTLNTEGETPCYELEIYDGYRE